MKCLQFAVSSNCTSHLCVNGATCQNGVYTSNCTSNDESLPSKCMSDVIQLVLLVKLLKNFELVLI